MELQPQQSCAAAQVNSTPDHHHPPSHHHPLSMAYNVWPQQVQFNNQEEEEENSRWRFCQDECIASSSTANFNRQLVAPSQGDFVTMWDIAPQFTYATCNGVTYNANNYASTIVHGTTSQFYGTATALQGLNATAARHMPPTISPSPAFWHTGPTSVSTHHNKTAGGEGSAPKRPKLSQPAQAAGCHPPSIQKMKKPVGRPRKDSYSLTQQPTQMQNKQTNDAIHMYPSCIQIGKWMAENIYGKDLIAKCYYGRRSFAWEILFRDDGVTVKKRMTFEWKYITSIEISSSLHPLDYEVLGVVVSKAPTFAKETKIPTGKHSSWGTCEDFTNGEALRCTVHVLTFERGRLSDAFKKRLKENVELRKLTHAAASVCSNKPVQGTINFSSHSSRINDVAGDHLIQNNQAANSKQIEASLLFQDVGDALTATDYEALGSWK